MVWYHYNKKRTTKDLLELNISTLKKANFFQKNTIKDGALSWTMSYGGGEPEKIGGIHISSNFIGENRYVTLIYTYKDQERIDYKVQITTTRPNYGGERYWFVCPRCGRIVASLYGDKYFLCRHCQNLTYKTQQIGFTSRMLERRNKYQDKVSKDGTKRRWIHWKRYHKLMDKAGYYEYQALISMHKALQKIFY